MIAEVLDGLAKNGGRQRRGGAEVKAQAIALCKRSRSTPDFAQANSGCPQLSIGYPRAPRCVSDARTANTHGAAPFS